MKKLSVVVLNWNREAETRRRLRRLSVWRRLQPEIRVVDNGSADGEGAKLEQDFLGVNWHLSQGGLVALCPAVQQRRLDRGGRNRDPGRSKCWLDRHPQLPAVEPSVLDEDGDRGIWTDGGHDVA